MKPANLDWRRDDPYNLDYGDRYHHSDGANEVVRVFVEPANLVQRFRKLGDGERFTIAELGFGTGLNLVVIAELWLQHAPNTSQLHFISTELHPISSADWQRLASQRCNQHRLYNDLQAQYPPLTAGWHRRHLASGRIMLSLYFGDATDGITELIGRQRQPVDAWLLDGFAPDRNPQMWSPALLQRLPALSAANTTVTTFTAVGAIRRRLANVGFIMQRVQQMPYKLHSLCGRLTSEAAGLSTLTPPKQVNIIGAGIAGASVAQHLAQAGVPCQVRDRGAATGGASRLPSVLLHARLLADPSPLGLARLQALQYAHTYCLNRPGYRNSGVLQIATDNASWQRLQHTANATPATDWLELLDAHQCQTRFGTNNPELQGAAFFPDAGPVQPQLLTANLLQHPLITLLPYTPSPLRQLQSQNIEHPTLLACGLASRQVAAAGYLEMAAVAGQLDLVEVATPPPIALAGDNYQLPQAGNRLWLGSTYEHRPWSPKQATKHNLQQLHQPYRWLARQRAIRCVTSDRWPLAGQLEPHGNLWVSAGHGSMGMVTAHYCASIISSQITGTFAPMSRAQEALFTPSRLLPRQQRRGYRMGAAANSNPG